jgi:hypothetical protein
MCALRGRGVIISFHILPSAIVCLNGLDASVGWFRSSQCLMSKIFETTYHHKLPFNSKDMILLFLCSPQYKEFGNKVLHVTYH